MVIAVFVVVIVIGREVAFICVGGLMVLCSIWFACLLLTFGLIGYALLVWVVCFLGLLCVNCLVGLIVCCDSVGCVSINWC